MLESAVAGLLDRLGTNRRPHEGGRSLREHLEGTYQRLSEWGNPDAVCLGGLFHSIYGTEYYPVASAGLEQRGVIRDCIGARAERLAYLYSACDRAHLLTNIGQAGGYAVLDRMAGADVAIDRQTLCDLLEIEIANLLDLAPPIDQVPDQTRARWFGRLAGAGAYVSAQAWRSFEGYFSVAGHADTAVTN
jgi:hypothetical protein